MPGGSASEHEPPVWRDRLTDLIAHERIASVRRVIVVARTGSTQDLASSLGPGSVGALVVAVEQTRGRGRFGRAWSHHPHSGLATTLVLDADRFADPVLPVRVGLAAAIACEEHLPGRTLGIRWPNDVVEHPSDGGGRKLGGVLIEHRDRRLLIGIGINVAHTADQWPGELAPVAVSLAQLGSGAFRIELLESLVIELDRSLAGSGSWVRAQWARRDALRGHRSVWHDRGTPIVGTVVGIDPGASLVLRLDDGSIRELDPATATHHPGNGGLGEPPGVQG